MKAWTAAANQLHSLCDTAPHGYETAGQLLVTAGDNPKRLCHEKSFAALCGSSLNRGGDRHANSALWTIVLVRMTNHPPTKAYVARRTALETRDHAVSQAVRRSRALPAHPAGRDASSGCSILLR